MSTPSEISEFQTRISQSYMNPANQSFPASTGRRILSVAPTFTVAMSMVAVNRRKLENWNQLVFVRVKSSHNELISALGNDYEAQAKVLQKLETLKESLSENWNGEDDCPIEEKAYNNTKIAIKNTPGVMLRHWRLFPNPNGTLLFSPKDKSIAGISIGNDEFSYAAFVSDDKQISGKEPFTVQAFKSAIMQIHRILGYD